MTCTAKWRVCITSHETQHIFCI